MAHREDVLNYLRGGNRRSLGGANRAAALARARPGIAGQLVRAMWHEDPVIRMRAADALEKASLEDSRVLSRYKAEILGLLAEAEQQELRWLLALMVPRLRLSIEERARAAEHLRGYLADRSSIVKTCALQGLEELAEQEDRLRGDVVEILRRASRTGTAAMRARSRKLLRRLKADI